MQDLSSFEGLEGELRTVSLSGRADYLLVAPSGVHLRLSPSAFHLIQAVRTGIGFDSLAEALSRRQGRTVSGAELRDTWGRLVAELTRAQKRKLRLPPGFWFRRRLVPERVVERIAARVTWPFSTGRVLFFLSLILAAAIFLASGSPQGIFASNGLFSSHAAFWPAYVLFLLSLFAHEIGHAGASARYGARPCEIGWTVYLIFPAVYCDITRVWSLTRWQRVVVDLGGIYFQLMVGALYALFFHLSGWRAFETAFWMILLSCLFSLNPVFRCDGYWALADALGLTQLDREPARLVRRMIDHIRGIEGTARCRPTLVTVALVLYTPVVLAVWLFFISRLIQELALRIAFYPSDVLRILESLDRLSLPDVALIWNLSVSTFLILCSGLVAFQVMKMTSAFVEGAFGRS